MNKLEGSVDGQDGLWQAFFASPLALEKLLDNSSGLKKVMRTPALIPFFFKSNVTPIAIYEAFLPEILEEEEQSNLEDYTREISIFSLPADLFLEEFVRFVSDHIAAYKALYLLALFSNSSGDPVKYLLERVDRIVISEVLFDLETQYKAILLPQAMSYLPNMPIDNAYNLGRYCNIWYLQDTSNPLRGEWLRLAEVFYQEASRQGDRDAKIALSGVLENQDKDEELISLLLTLVNKGDIEARCLLGSYYKRKGQKDKAEIYYQQAAAQGDIEAQRLLTILLKGEDAL